MKNDNLGELVSARVAVSGYVGGPSALVVQMELSNNRPVDFWLRGIDAADDLIAKLVAARNKTWPWPPLVVAQQPEVQP